MLHPKQASIVGKRAKSDDVPGPTIGIRGLVSPAPKKSQTSWSFLWLDFKREPEKKAVWGGGVVVVVDQQECSGVTLDTVFQ